MQLRNCARAAGAVTGKYAARRRHLQTRRDDTRDLVMALMVAAGCLAAAAMHRAHDRASGGRVGPTTYRRRRGDPGAASAIVGVWSPRHEVISPGVRQRMRRIDWEKKRAVDLRIRCPQPMMSGRRIRR